MRHTMRSTTAATHSRCAVNPTPKRIAIRSNNSSSATMAAPFLLGQIDALPGSVGKHAPRAVAGACGGCSEQQLLIRRQARVELLAPEPQEGGLVRPDLHYADLVEPRVDPPLKRRRVAVDIR